MKRKQFRWEKISFFKGHFHLQKRHTSRFQRKQEAEVGGHANLTRFLFKTRSIAYLGNRSKAVILKAALVRGSNTAEHDSTHLMALVAVKWWTSGTRGTVSGSKKAGGKTGGTHDFVMGRVRFFYSESTDSLHYSLIKLRNLSREVLNTVVTGILVSDEK